MKGLKTDGCSENVFSDSPNYISVAAANFTMYFTSANFSGARPFQSPLLIQSIQDQSRYRIPADVPVSNHSALFGSSITPKKILRVR